MRALLTRGWGQAQSCNNRGADGIWAHSRVRLRTTGLCISSPTAIYLLKKLGLLPVEFVKLNAFNFVYLLT